MFSPSQTNSLRFPCSNPDDAIKKLSKNTLEKFLIAAAASDGYVRHSVSLKMSSWFIVSRITQLVDGSRLTLSLMQTI